MLKFEAGDLVRCILKARKGYDGEVGRIYEVDGIGGGLSFKGYPYGGNEPSRFELYKKKGEEMYTVGDKVKITDKNRILGPHGFKVGEVVTLDARSPFSDRSGVKAWKIGKWFVLEGEFKKAEEMQYEDKWNLNDGSVEVPDDAEKLMNPEGTSVVAFRYAKKSVVSKYRRYIGVGRAPNPSVFVYKDSTGTPRHTTPIEVTVTDGKVTDIKLLED